MNSTLFIVGRAESAEPQMHLFTPAARSVVRYADPLSWTAATAVALAFGATQDQFRSVRNEAGLITISPDGPAQTIAALAQSSADGFSSPLRYPAAGPGALAGVVCIMQELRGPTMNLTMPPALALPAATTLAEAWIANHQTPLVALLTSRRIAEGKYLARCVLLTPSAMESASNAIFSANECAWLSSEGEL